MIYFFNFKRGIMFNFIFFFSSRRRHTRLQGDWSSDVCSSDLLRGSLGSVNDIAAGVNVALRTAGEGANRLTQVAARSWVPAQSTLYGMKVGARSLLRSFTGLNGASIGEETDDRRN